MLCVYESKAPEVLTSCSMLATVLSVLACIATVQVCATDLIIGTPLGLSISNDGGATWKSKNVGYVNAIFAGDNVTYVGTKRGLIVTKDKGKTWSSKYIGHVNKIGVSLDDPDIICIGLEGDRLAISTDGGSEWTATKILPFPLQAMEIQANNLYVGTVDGISVAYNLTQWITQHVGQVFSMTLGCNTVYVGTNNGVLRTVDKGETWMPWGMQGHQITAMFLDGGTLYTFDDRARLSTRKLNAWQHGLGPEKVTSIFAQGDNVYLGQPNGGGLAISRDGGRTWNFKKKEHGLADNTVTAVSILE